MNQQTPPELPEATRIDYAPPSPPRQGRFWRVLIALFSTICLAIGVGAGTACLLDPHDYHAPQMGAIGAGFLTAGIALPLMICLMRRL